MALTPYSVEPVMVLRTCTGVRTTVWAVGTTTEVDTATGEVVVKVVGGGKSVVSVVTAALVVVVPIVVEVKTVLVRVVN